MGEVKHLCLVKFKEDAVVDDILQGMTKLVSDMDMVKSFEWGKDVSNQDMLTQGFTHVFSVSFASSEDLTSYVSHARHLEFASTFMAAIDKNLSGRRLSVLSWCSLLLAVMKLYPVHSVQRFAPTKVGGHPLYSTEKEPVLHRQKCATVKIGDLLNWNGLKVNANRFQTVSDQLKGFR
ncbi:hypothetical protein GUJ93_ZPchr0011g28403 [Zizania palustris]|uniref:Stress-response A/B barrel domain-containing protein n=1 Tax=Zizania palustris TaxID=103762 RepID=A0A8J6BS90_ZIZPA|nr:hypothetical protein GUJ93_ZPchr0011g28403 [Zizania palustris]